MVKPLWTSQLAEACGVSRSAVLHYERLGLLPKPPRQRSGYRLYRPEAVAILRFIVAAKKIGFTLTEIKHLLALRRDAADCATVHAVIRAKLDETDAELARLKETRRTLAAQTRATSPEAPAARHPVFVSS
jgi:MerR family transcriptional regulator, Zn(II)-responsive regulator of zntA